MRIYGQAGAVRRGLSTAALGLLGALCAAATAQAAPRLSDDVPDAAPLAEGSWAISYGLDSIELDGPLTTERTSHNYYKLQYAFSPDVAAAVHYQTHSLGGGMGLLSPVFDNQDEASALGFDLGVNLLDVPMIQRVVDPVSGAETVPFAAGSSFGMGVGLTRYQVSAASLSQEDLLLRAYLTYSTDLTDQMRAHTYFSTGRLSGDTHTGSVNRVAAGLDYNLTGGKRPLVLMANGVLDIYNFRQPSFNTSRISRFDVGLRYRIAEDWYASAGWTTLNDSENDASGSGIFAGLSFVDEPGPPAPAVEAPAEVPAPEAPPEAPAPVATAPADAVAAPVETPPAAVETAPAEAAPEVPTEAAPVPAPVIEEQVLVLPDARADSGAARGVSSAGGSSAPAMMDIPYTPPQDYMVGGSEAAVESDYVSGGPYAYDPERARSNAEYVARLEKAAKWSDLPVSESTGDNGIVVPGFPQETSAPEHTAADARMQRPGLAAGVEADAVVPVATAGGLLATSESAISVRASAAGNSAAGRVQGAVTRLKVYTFGNWARISKR